MTWVNFQTVRDELDFETVLTHYGFEIKANGKDQVKVHCPFHDDSNPSCGVNLTKKVFHCFSCQAKGNILDFYTKMEGMDPAKTQDLRKAALLAVEVFDIDGGSQEAKTGDQPKAKQNAVKSQKRPAKQVENREPSEGSKKVVSSDTKQSVANEGEIKPTNPPLSFELQLDASHAYLGDRSITKELVEEFGLGYAKRGSMKGRVCFPIHNEGGELIAYSGRWVDGEMPEGVSRYLLPKGFEKSKVLFNLNRLIEAKANGDDFDTVIIVEGFWSVLRLHEAGIPVVSTFGDSVSEAQVDLLVQAGIDKCILTFDGDEGGRLGTEQALPVLASRIFVRSIALEEGVKPDTMSEGIMDSLPRYR